MEYNLLYSVEKLSSLSPSEKPEQATEQKWEIGQIIDNKYEIEDILAEDEHKIIHKVRHCQWNIPLVVRSQKQTDDKRVQFFHQAEQWVALEKHPNIVGAYYLQNIGGMPRLFVEYIKAQTLLKFIQNNEYDVATILDIAIQICWGMEHAHQKGLLHGDLREGNIFITEDHHIKITDFRSREEGIVQCSPYMPPEQLEANPIMRPSVDIYAFGVILYELCLKELPFKIAKQENAAGKSQEFSMEEFKNIVLTQPPAAPHKLNPDIPQALSEIILQCLAINPNERPSSFQNICSQLKPIYSQVTGFRYPREAPEHSKLIAVDLNNRALSLLDLNQEKKAEEYLEQAIDSDPLCTGAIINLNLLKLYNGKTNLYQFRKETEKLLTQDEEVVTFYRAKICLDYGGFLEESLAEVKRALGKFPHNRELFRLKGCLLKRLGKWSQAKEIFHELSEQDNPTRQDNYELVHCYVALNNPQKAKQVIEKSRLLFSDTIEMTLAEAVILAQQGKIEEGYMIFSRLTENYPDNLWPQLHLAELSAAFGQYVKAYSKATPNQQQAQQLYQKLWEENSYFPRILHGYFFVYGEYPAAPSHFKGKNRSLWSYSRSLSGHEAGVHCIAISPNSKIAIAGGADQNLRIWEIQNARCKHTLPAHEEGTKQICISHDGHFAATIGRENFIKVWDLVVGKPITSFDGKEEGKLEGHVREVTCMNLTATGYLVSGSLDKTIRVWDLGALECRKILKGHTGKITCLETTARGEIAVSGSEDNKIGIWDIEQGISLALLEGHREGITCLAVSPDGRYAVSGGWDQKLLVWDLDNHSQLHKLEGHSGSLNCLEITPDGKWVVSGSEDRTLRVWDLATGKCIHVLEGHTGVVTCLAIAPKSRFVVSGSWDHNLRIWCLDRGVCLAVLEGHSDLLNTISITADESMILSGGDDKILRVWTDLTTAMLPSYKETPLSYLLQRPTSHDGNIAGQRKVVKLLREANDKLQQGDFATSLGLYREIQEVEGFDRNSRILKSIHATAWENNLVRENPRDIWQKHSLSPNLGPITCTRVTHNGKYLVVGGKANSLVVWNLEKNKQLFRLEGHENEISCVALSPNDRFIVSGSRDNSIRLWELENGSCIYNLAGHNYWIEDVCFTPDGRKIISGGRDGSIRIWELKTGHRIYSLGGHTDLISTLCIANDTYMISASHDRSIKVWELESGQYLHTLEMHRNHVKCLSVLPGSDFLASGGWDNVIYLWNLKDGDCVHKFQGHQSWINKLLATADGKLVSASLDQSVRVWSVEDRKCLFVLKGHEEDVTHLALTSDGRYCISASTDGTIKVWSLQTGELCSTVGSKQQPLSTLCTFSGGRFFLTGYQDGTIRVWEVDWQWRMP